MATGFAGVAGSILKAGGVSQLSVSSAGSDGLVRDASGMPIGRVVTGTSQGYTDQTGSATIYHPGGSYRTVLSLLPYKGKSKATGQWLPDPAKFPTPAGYPYPGDFTVALDAVLPAAKAGKKWGGVSEANWNLLSKRKKAIWNTGRSPGDELGGDQTSAALALLSAKERAIFLADMNHSTKGTDQLNTIAGIAIGIGVAGIATAGIASAVMAPAATAAQGTTLAGAATEAGAVTSATVTTTAPTLESLAGLGSMTGAAAGGSGSLGAAAAAAGTAAAGAGGSGLLAAGGTAALAAGKQLASKLLPTLLGGGASSTSSSPTTRSTTATVAGDDLVARFLRFLFPPLSGGVA